MPIDALEQSAIQATIEKATPAELAYMKEDAQHVVDGVRYAFSRGNVTDHLCSNAEYAIEVIARIECFEEGCGESFRIRRRAQLAATFMRKAS
jgi:hypothetical protein